jgi:hypothetical protein
MGGTPASTLSVPATLRAAETAGSTYSGAFTANVTGDGSHPATALTGFGQQIDALDGLGQVSTHIWANRCRYTYCRAR